MEHSKKTVAVAPGFTIREQIENRDMSQKEFAQRMDLSEKHISRLINGKVELTSDVALRLENVLGLPAKFWNRLEAIYREQLARVHSELEDEHDQEMVSEFQYAKLSKAGFVPKVRDINEKVNNLRNFFEVAKLDVIDNLEIPGIAFRKSGSNSKSDYLLAAWAQKARIEARNINTNSINISGLRQEISLIRSFTVLPPNEFVQQLQDVLAGCGVALVYLPHVEGSFLSGASFLDGKKIVLGLTVRGKDADKFWFSLFHELFHIIDGHISTIGNTTDQEERDADEFARDTLIKPADFAQFIDLGNYSRLAIVEFSNQIHISPGITLGRLQKEGYVKYSQYNDLKEKYKIIK